jgi:hypothetical protein
LPRINPYSVVPYLVKSNRIYMCLHCHIFPHIFQEPLIYVGIKSCGLSIKDKISFHDKNNFRLSVAQSYRFPTGPCIYVINLMLLHDVSICFGKAK